jgi:hypothetical protein
MKKAFIIIFITLLPASWLLAQQEQPKQQDYSNKLDLKVGIGPGFITWGDLLGICFETELNYKINKYFTAAASFGIGRADRHNEFDEHNDYLQGSVNVFLSPFGNNRRNNFRIGTGYTFINQTTAYVWNINRIDNYKLYIQDRRSEHCFNMIIEDEFKITPRLMIGAKLFLTGNLNIKQGAEMWGGLIKFGVVL